MKRTTYFCFATFIIFLFYLTGVQALCCGGVCRSDGKCCDETWYIGCKSADGNIFCPDDALPPDWCLVCECSSPESCNWIAYDLLCEECEEYCSYEGSIDLPSSSECSPKECAEDDADCDGVPDITDECPDTPPCADMDPEADGCSTDQVKAVEESYEVPGLGVNFFSFFLVVLVLSALLVYNFERIF